MKKFACLLYTSVALFLPAAPLTAAKDSTATTAPTTKPSDGGTAGPELRGEYALIAAQAELTGEQRTQLAAIVTEARAAEARMQAANKDKLGKLRKDLADARKSNNRQAIAKASQQIMKINSAATKAKKALRARVLGLLTPEQKIKWAGFVFYRSACGVLAKANLTDDQKTAARKLCDEAARQLGAAALKKSRKTVAAQKKLLARIKADILSDRQRDAPGAKVAGPDKPPELPGVYRPISPAGKSMKAPAFRTLSAAVGFIASCLEEYDLKKLSDACLQRPNVRNLQTLRNLNQSKPLKKLYAGKTFPSGKKTFKLGGHAKELDHIHIDFIVRGGAWRLCAIWMCK